MKLTPTEPDVRTIVERIDRGDIDLQPDFQRQEVWSTAKKKKLIDTVLRGWSIPPVHLVETDDSRLEVLDGQQRLAALRDFVHDKFSIDGKITPTDTSVSPLHGRFYKQLDDATRRRVDQYPIRCFRITDYQPEEPSELFYRLNQPTMLTAGEQRNALYGPARVQMKALVERFERLGNSRETIGFSNTRLAYDDIFARFLFFLEQRSFGSKGTEGVISERFREKRPFSPSVENSALQSIEAFSIARRQAQPYRFNKASLLSWLLFYVRFVDDPPYHFLQQFIDAAEARSASTAEINKAILLFEDRSSLRVTDVSSVVYRDFSLFYLFMKLNENARIPDIIPLASLIGVDKDMHYNDDFDLEFVLGHNITVESWSGTL